MTIGAAVAIAVLTAGLGARGPEAPGGGGAVMAAESAPPTSVEPAAGHDSPEVEASARSPMVVEGGSLEALLSAAGHTLPSGTSVYVARVLAGADGLATYVTYEAGGGGADTGLWPASSVKVLAAVGALAFLKSLGLTGTAVVGTDGWSATVSELYDEAIRTSSNDAYDHLVEIAGVDWLNEEFLTAANGFAETVIQRSYSHGDVISSPAMTLADADHTVTIPARTPSAELGVPDGGNRSSLREMVDSVRRVMLDSELPETERLGLAPTDLAAMADALLGSEGFIEPGVADAFGAQALVYNKPGWVSESCIDVGLVVDATSGRRLLLGVATPDDGTECTALATVAGLVLSTLPPW